MRTSTIITLAVVWTVLVAAMVEFAQVSGGVVIAVAFAWFMLGRMIGRTERRPITRWGRQR